MGYTVTGKVIDDKRDPVSFGIVFASDSTGKPKSPANTAETNIDGKWSLNNLTDNDFITIRMIGTKTKTFPAKSVIPVTLPGMPFPVRSIQTQLVPDTDATSLAEVEIVANKPPVKKKKSYVVHYIIGGIAFAIILTASYLMGRQKAKRMAVK